MTEGDCDQAVSDLVEKLRELGADDEMIQAALRKALDDIKYKHW